MPCLQGKWDDGLGQMRRLQRDGKGAQVNLLCTRERKARRRAYHAGRNAIADEAGAFYLSAALLSTGCNPASCIC